MRFWNHHHISDQCHRFSCWSNYEFLRHPFILYSYKYVHPSLPKRKTFSPFIRFLSGATIAFCYIYQIILFGSSVALYNECIRNNRHTLFLCVVDQNESSTDQRKPRHRRQKQCLPWKDMLLYIIKQLFTRPGQIIICTIFFIYTVMAIYGALQIKDGMQFGQLLNDKSYAKHYFDTLDQEFELYPLVQFIITEPIPYWRTDYMNRIENLAKRAKELEGRREERKGKHTNS